MYGLVSGLLISILTQRVFYVDWSFGAHIHSCFLSWAWNAAHPHFHDREQSTAMITEIDSCFQDTPFALSYETEDLNDIVPKKNTVFQTNYPH